MKVSHRHPGSVLPALLTACLAAGLVALLILLLDRQPLVEHPGPLGGDSLRQIEQLIVDNSPEQLSRNGRRRIELSTGELNLLTTFLLQRLPMDRDVALRIRPLRPTSHVEVSLPLGEGRLRSYLNLSASIHIENGLPRLVSLRAGHLPVPELIQERLVAVMIRFAERRDLRQAALAELQQTVQEVEILDDGVAVTLQWQFDALARLRNQARHTLLGNDGQRRLLHYYRLAHAAGMKQEDGGTLNQWLAVLFTSALERTRQGADVIKENRSALQALALYANDIDPRLLIAHVPDALLRSGGRIPPMQQRRDLTRHLLMSAAISASAGAPVAGLLASSKELHDARHGSGFSVSDMMANQAGTRLGLAAVSGQDTALLVQQRLAGATSDSLFMPRIEPGDPGLDEESFRARFGSTGSASFRQMMTRLDEHIDALPLYREP